MLTKKDYQTAIDIQSASNLSGVVNSLNQIMPRIWKEARSQLKGTDWVNQHPICRLFAEQIYHLSGAGIPSNAQSYEAAYSYCENKI